MTTLIVNGTSHEVAAEPGVPLLYWLRGDLGLNGAKYGCGLGQCGACTVIVEGEAVLSCVVPVSALDGKRIKTLEGLGTEDRPGPMQRAFMDEQAAQCGYCIPGMMMKAQALLDKRPEASDEEVRAALQTNLCRCGTHMRILRAVRRAAEAMRRDAAAPVRLGDAQ